MKDKPKDILIAMIAANVLSIACLILAGWFAYLDNGNWGWPFIGALLAGRVAKTSEDKFKEERERAEAKAESIKKYGYNIYNN